MIYFNYEKKSPLLAFIKFEPTFFQVLWRFAFSLPFQGEAGGKGVWSLPFRPPSPLMKSVRIFSNTLRQLGNSVAGSPATRARHPILNAKLNFLSLFRETERQKRAFLEENQKICYHNLTDKSITYFYTIKIWILWQQ